MGARLALSVDAGHNDHIRLLSAKTTMPTALSN